jgi:hypothetical protein
MDLFVLVKTHTRYSPVTTIPLVWYSVKTQLHLVNSVFKFNQL